MLQDGDLPPDFRAVTEPDEKVLWTGKPMFWPFVLHAVPLVVIGIVWTALDSGLHGDAYRFASRQDALAFYTFIVLHSLPAWGSIAYAAYLGMVHSNTVYGYTNRRLLMRSGVIGTSFKSIDYDTIQELDVTVGIIDRLFNTGTVRAFTGQTTSKGARLYDQFVSIANAYDVFRAIKGVEVDVKTDWNYPNALRPAANAGYKTELEPNV